MPKDNQKVDVINILLDENNHEPIIMYGEDDEEIRFAQVATIPLYGNLYEIMKPIDKLDGVANDEALVFLIDYDEDGHSFLIIEQNEEIAQKVFGKYQRLLEVN